MARKPRPIDPAEGPIQAFAFELRKVREEAGSPTYRALAGLAGYSATTLSDAAGGVRAPSLEVTLAYVGACGGDGALWEKRWQELDQLLTSERAALSTTETAPLTESGTRTPTTGRPEPQLDGIPSAAQPEARTADTASETASSRRLSGRQLKVGAVVAVVLAIGLGLLALRRSPGTPAAAASVGACAVSTDQGVRFSGTTYNPTTRIRSGASRTAPVVRQVAAACKLGFTGYCLGDIAVDTASGTPDMRWFKVAGGGVVSSAVIHGSPPSDLPPSRCADDVPSPSAVTLSAASGADAGTIDLRAAGSHVGIVGYAAYYAAGTGPKPALSWHQIALRGSAADQFTAPWRLGPLRDASPDDAAIRIVAVVCFAADSPTRIADSRTLHQAAPAELVPAPLTDAELTTAGRAACQYPDPS